MHFKIQNEGQTKLFGFASKGWPMSLDKRSCLARAQALLLEGKPDGLRYAALELRLCIEALTYEKLRAFSDIVPEDVLKTWQPPQAVKALLEFEPDGDKTFELFAGVEEEYGKPAPIMQFVGKHTSLRLGWLRKHYNKLGKLLHAPSPGEKPPKPTVSIKQYLEEVVADLREPVESTITGGAFREVFHCTCSQCGKPVICNAETARKKQKAVCPNPQCGAEYFVSTNSLGQASFRLMTTAFDCSDESCPGVAEIENRKLNVGLEFDCPVCGLKHSIVERHWGYGPTEAQ